MGASSVTGSQTDFCDAVSRVDITSEPTSGYDTPIPRARISDDTIQTLNTVSTRIEGLVSNNNNPAKGLEMDHLTEEILKYLTLILECNTLKNPKPFT